MTRTSHQSKKRPFHPALKKKKSSRKAPKCQQLVVIVLHSHTRSSGERANGQSSQESTSSRSSTSVEYLAISHTVLQRQFQEQSFISAQILLIIYCLVQPGLMRYLTLRRLVYELLICERKLLYLLSITIPSITSQEKSHFMYPISHIDVIWASN